MRGFVAAMGAGLLGAAISVGTIWSAEAKQNQEYTTGQWSGYSYINDDDGQFTDCTAWASSNEADIQLGVSVRTDWTLRLYLYSESWNLPQNQSYPVSYWVDRGGQYHGKVVTAGKSSVYVDADESNNVFQALKAGSELTVRTSADDYVFNLQGSRNALSQLVDCVDHHTKEATTNPFGPGSGDQGNTQNNNNQQQTNEQQNDNQSNNSQSNNSQSNNSQSNNSQSNNSQQGGGSDDTSMKSFTVSVEDVQKFLVDVTGAKPSMIKISSKTDKAGAIYYDFTTPLGGGQFWQEKLGADQLADISSSYIASYRKECKGDFDDSPLKPMQGEHGNLSAGTAACSNSPYQDNGPEFLSYSMTEDQGVVSVYVTYTGGNAAKAKSDSLGRLIEKRYEDLIR